MNLKMLSIATVALTISGGAFAQDSGSTGARLDNKEMMGSFYTDSEMQSVKTGDEFSAAYNALSSEDKEAIANECNLENSPRATFCNQVKGMAK